MRRERRARPTISQHEIMRRRFGYTVTALARAVGVSHAYVSRVEGGIDKPSPRYREAVSAVLGVPEGLIFEQVTTTPRLQTTRGGEYPQARRLK